MAIIKCKMCGGDIELTTDKTFGTCEYCGSTMTLPKVDDDQRAAAFNRGNHFRRIGEFDKALAVYENIVRENDSDAEAHWCCALCRFGIEYVEDPSTYEWLPTCHRASFDSFLEDVDYLAAVEHSDGITRRQYQKDAAKIAEVQKGILATSQNEEPFDVFICYKESDENGNRTVDSTLAQDIYYQLTEQGYRVFFARITLEDVVGTQYEPYIFAALNSAKVMVALGTRAEHFNAVWVKNEWSRFLAMMRKDRSKLLLPCYRDMDPYDMPEQLGVLQSYDMSKIGFVQDLLRGIAKVLDAGKKPEVKETVVVQQTGGPGGNVGALLKRGNMALEDGDWARADEFFEEVLNQDAECAEAYLGKLLAAQQVSTLEKLVGKRLADTQKVKPDTINLPTMDAHFDEVAQNYVVPNYLSKEDIIDEHYAPIWHPSYKDPIPVREQQIAAEPEFWNENKHYQRAVKFASADLKRELAEVQEKVIQEMRIRIEQEKEPTQAAKVAAETAYAEKVAQAEEAARAVYEATLAKREEDYQSLCCEMDNEEATADDFYEISQKLSEIGNYKDCEERIDVCKQRAEAYLEKMTKEEPYQQWKERMKTNFLPSVSGALNGFEKLGDFKDSAQLAELCRKKIVLLTEDAKLRSELTHLKGLFAGKRREEIEKRLAQIKMELRAM